MIQRTTTFYFVCVVALAMASASCGPLPRSRSTRGGGGGTAGGDAAFTSQCRGDFGTSAAANRFEALMGAVWELHQAATDTQRTLLEACQQMGREMDMDDSALRGDGPEGTREVCGAVATFLSAELAAIRQASGVTVEVRTRPPHCEARFDAYADCAARCDVSVTPGELEMRCEGGEIRGECSAECTGRCAVDASAECSGRCEGICDGTCTARAADGSCAGECQGTCRGECVTEVTGECGGECRGSCSVEWVEPYCTGRYSPPEVDADCRAACEARVEASMECTPGEAEMVVTGGPDEAMQERIAKVRDAIVTGLATILTVRERVRRLQESGRIVLQRIDDLPDAIRDVGISAAACSAGALADLQRSMAAISVSVEVTVEISASASVSSG